MEEESEDEEEVENDEEEEEENEVDEEEIAVGSVSLWWQTGSNGLPQAIQQ